MANSLLSAKDALLSEKDKLIASQTEKLAESQSVIDSQAIKLSQLTDSYNLLSGNYTKLQGQVENLTTTYGTLKIEHEQLLILLADMTSAQGKSPPVYHRPPESNISLGEKQKSGIFPLLWKIVPRQFQPQIEEEPTSHEYRPVHEAQMALCRDSLVQSPVIKTAPDTCYTKDQCPPLTTSSIATDLPLLTSDFQFNNPESRSSLFSPYSSLSIEYPNLNYGSFIAPNLDFNSNNNFVHNLNLEPNSDNISGRWSGQAIDNTEPSMPSNVTTCIQQPFIIPPSVSVHPYYLGMKSAQLSFEESLGFVPQPEPEY